jgi:hypothetical protein
LCLVIHTQFAAKNTVVSQFEFMAVLTFSAKQKCRAYPFEIGKNALMRWLKSSRTSSQIFGDPPLRDAFPTKALAACSARIANLSV